MQSVILALSFAAAAAAQVVNGGISYVPVEPTAAVASSSGSDYAAPTAAAHTTAAPSEPSPSSIYDAMPYEAYKDGGYKDLDCGYGYKKGEDGKCAAESWVSPRLFSLCLC